MKGWLLLSLMTFISVSLTLMLMVWSPALSTTGTNHENTILGQGAIPMNVPDLDTKISISTTTTITTTTTTTTLPAKENKNKTNVTIAYVTSIAYCPSGKANPANVHGVRDGPRIMAHSIATAHERSRYQYKLYAIVSSKAVECVKDYLTDYEILERELPVQPNQVQTKEYAHLIKFGSGCCGAAEFLKLYAYTLVKDEIVVHLDYDSIMLQPMDELYDAMLSRDASSHKLSIPRNGSIPTRVDAFFTRDYIQRCPLAPYQPRKYALQGGFFIIRPNITLYHEMVSILRRGNYTDQTGWENSRIGNFYGAAQIQGFLAYIYAELYPENAVELNRCIYNTMVYEEPLDERGKCRTEEDICEDCRITPLQDMKLVHYAMCQDPWYCQLPTFGQPPKRCQDVLTEWFRVRRGLEQKLGHAVPHYESTDWTLGYCPNGTYSPMRVALV